MVRLLTPFVVLLSLPLLATAQPVPLVAPTPVPPPPIPVSPLPALAPAASVDGQALSKVLHDLLLQNLPDPILESAHGWDHQKEILVGLKWRREGPIRVKAEGQHAMRNDGHWQKIRVQGVDPARTLAVGVRDVKHVEAGKTTFEAMIGLDTRITYEQQLWKSGAKLYSGETRAKCRAALRLTCELTSRFDRKPGSFLSDIIVRVRVTDAELFYTNLEVEHTLGVGGDAAKLLGDAALKFIRQVKPSLERDLLARANQAIVKAADTKDVRLAFDKLLGIGLPSVPLGPAKP
ncbi:hypothetical protein [Fimbriiglobus ruber]|uniref:Uncharacterized protein n=1 Tax=Fimbriiglobus ruber TaxID=1908690 RepID=A0A225DQR3_9BACT|nr:hypothetical protein [Fimbriiglobus ruber]OWK38705.1 hypothetical protein FRUB_07825 [Fimbriiglobus ruber]